MTKKKIISIMFLVIAMVAAIRVYIDNSIIQVTNVEVVSEKIPASFEGYKILQLSDLHSREFGRENKRLIQKINEIEPDILVFTGDMVTGNDKNFTVFFELVENLSKKYPIYFISGNHESALRKSAKQEFLELFEKNGVVFLDNKKVELKSSNGDAINLYGLCYPNTYYQVKTLNMDLLQEFIGVSENFTYNILLAHQPKYFELYKEWGADLILSGHVHGGMVRLPVLGPVFSPDGGLFPEYSEGEYKLGEATLVVSRGLGIGTRGFRVFNRPELVLITLRTR